jgi:hypothetical protein
MTTEPLYQWLAPDGSCKLILEIVYDMHPKAIAEIRETALVMIIEKQVLKTPILSSLKDLKVGDTVYCNTDKLQLITSTSLSIPLLL